VGIGNILFRDDGIGEYIVKELEKLNLPESVELLSAGVGGFELLSYIEGREKVIIIDAVLTPDPPGTIHKFTPEQLKTANVSSTLLHNIGIRELLTLAEFMEYTPKIVVFGVTPKDIGTYGMELTSELKTIVPEIIDIVLKEIPVKT
jgi:hydrogenase maturation protease